MRGVFKKDLYKEVDAFTLIEAIMVIVLMAIIGTTAAMLIRIGTDSFVTMQTKAELASKGRLTVERMTREIRLVRCSTVSALPAPTTCAPDATDITTSTATEIGFDNTNNEAIGFRLSGTDIEMRLTAGDYLLADNATAFNIDYLDNTGAATATVANMWAFEVTFTLSSGSESLDFTARVHPRRFR